MVGGEVDKEDEEDEEIAGEVDSEKAEEEGKGIGEAGGVEEKGEGYL